MQPLVFQYDLDFEYGQAARIAPNIRRIVAPNPSPFTLYGTNTYIVGNGRVAIIDPGPALAEHVKNIEALVENEIIEAILVTHTHRDHSPAATELQERTGAPTYGFGPHGQTACTEPTAILLEEGVDRSFTPSIVFRDGDVLRSDNWTLQAIHTPGHTSNHLCYAFQEEGVVFTGDHIMAWSTSVVCPPDGDMNAYIASLKLLAERQEHTFWPAHGPCIDKPQAYTQALIEHRMLREKQLEMHLQQCGPQTIAEIVTTIYASTPVELHPAAALSVYAHLIALVGAGRVNCTGEPKLDTLYHL